MDCRIWIRPTWQNCLFNMIDQAVVSAANPQIWADQGGLIGLIVLGLFVLIGSFIYAMIKIMQTHRADISHLLQTQSSERDAVEKQHGQERDSWLKMVADLHEKTNVVLKETNVAINGMSATIQRLADRSRMYDERR